jgi:hypothetical protein
MLIMIILGVAFVTFCVLAFFAMRYWHIGHILVLAGVFVFSLLLFVLAGLVARAELGWRKVHQDLVKKVESKEAELRYLTQGALLEPPGEEKSIPELKHALERQLINRGRVWRGGALVSATETTFTLNLVGWGDTACDRVGLEEDGLAEEEAVPSEGEEGAEGVPAPIAGAPVPHGITKDMFIYAFLEYPPRPGVAEYLFGSKEQLEKDGKGMCRLPSVYVGRFRVQESNETTVTLELLDSLLEVTRQALGEGSPTWALYESLPKDDYAVFEGITPEQLQALRPGGIDDKMWAETVEDFLRDGQPAKDGDLDERKRIKVKFTKAKTIPVDVEGAGGEAGGASTSPERAYDPSGRAAYIFLQQGKPTEFAEGDEVVFDGVTAKRLVADGDATFSDEPPIYRRQLRDFDTILSGIAADRNTVLNDIAVAEKNAASFDKSIAEAKAQIEANKALIQALSADQARFKDELDHITRVAADLSEKRGMQLQELSRLYQSNLAMRRELMGTAPVVSVEP